MINPSAIPLTASGDPGAGGDYYSHPSQSAPGFSLFADLIPYESLADWHDLRKTGIGASDASAVAGLSRYKTPLQIYRKKTEPVHQTEESPAMEWGTRKEPIILQAYADKTGREVLRPDGILKSKKFPWMLASLDGFTHCGRVIEAKTASSDLDWSDPWTDEIPIEYLCQVQHAMVVTGYHSADIPVLIGTCDFRIYRDIEADPEVQEMLIAREKKFWDRVINKEPPEPRRESDLDFWGPKIRNSTVLATSEIYDLYRKLSEIKKKLKAYEAEEAEIKEKIQIFMRENDTLLWDESPIITWKDSRPSKKFNEKAFKTDHPKLYEDYIVKIPGSRRFTLKGENHVATDSET